MIKINQIKIPIFQLGKDNTSESELLRKAISKKAGCNTEDIRKVKILRRSIDARDKTNILYVYTVDVKLRDSLTGPTKKTELSFINSLKNGDITQENFIPLMIPKVSSEISERPVIIGSGPCGLFAAITLIKAGLKPVIIERGDKMDARFHVTENSYKTSVIDGNSNVLFGEGGAGTFSDGKLTTSVKGQDKYIRFIMETFIEHGADESILYDHKPHIGTDVLRDVIVSIRHYIEDNGGEYLFNKALVDFKEDNNRITSIVIKDTKSNKSSELKCSNIILAIGHSARDTYEMLYNKNVSMEQKAFAVGVRVQHPQSMINEAMYGRDRIEEKVALLGPAPYKLTYRSSNGRGVYSFCMCPGGYVINSSSEQGMLNINGMSYHDRSSGIANSAIVVNVDPSDFKDDSPLSGIEYQRELEKKAYESASGLIPYETFADFKNASSNPTAIPTFDPCFKGLAFQTDITRILPKYLYESICEGMQAFGRTIKGFDRDDCIISGIEARTSSPVRITRNDDYFSSVSGLIPAGEGAGYAGGITSAAADGIRAALKLIDSVYKDNSLLEVDSVIFDIDGTMWDSTSTLAKAYTAASKELGYNKFFTDDEVYAQLGHTNPVIFRNLYPEFDKGIDDIESKDLYDHIIDVSVSYESRLITRYGGKLFEGIENALRYLSEKTKLYIVSNCDTSYIYEFLEYTGFSKYFSGAMCHEDTGRDKGYTLKALVEKYDLKAPVYVGDIENDANACLFAGMPFIFASYGFGEVPKEKYIFKIERPDEIIGKLSFRNNNK